MATSAVFDAVELLENILLELPMLDIFLAQRVCRHRKDVIAGLQMLQTALSLRPIADVENLACGSEGELEPSFVRSLGPFQHSHSPGNRGRLHDFSCASFLFFVCKDGETVHNIRSTPQLSTIQPSGVHDCGRLPGSSAHDF